MRGLFLCMVLSLCVALPLLEAGEVSVRGGKGSWHLKVDGESFYIRGVGCGLASGREGQDYLKLAQELGANTVRTWGTDQGDQEYLDRAAAYGLKVCAGIWLNYADENGRFSYLRNKEYKSAKKKEVLEYVQKYKDHPAILLWGIGNECIFFTKDEKEKVALCRFMEELIQEVHRIDPAHPVIYASAGICDLKYLVQYVPSLDIVGINEYGSIRTAHGNWDYLGFDKPYVFTEYGPFLNIDSRRDEHSKGVELSDENKANIYKSFTEQIHSFKGYNLGGFAFHLGETTQESMTWWNINQGDYKRPSYWTIYQCYTGIEAPKRASRIKKFTLSRTKGLEPGEWFEVNVVLEPADIEGLVFEYAVSSSEENILRYYVNDYVPAQVSGEGSRVKIRAPLQKGVYRVYCFVRDEKNNVISANKSIRVESQQNIGL